MDPSMATVISTSENRKPGLKAQDKLCQREERAKISQQHKREIVPIQSNNHISRVNQEQDKAVAVLRSI